MLAAEGKPATSNHQVRLSGLPTGFCRQGLPLGTSFGGRLVSPFAELLMHGVFFAVLQAGQEHTDDGEATGVGQDQT